MSEAEGVMHGRGQRPAQRLTIAGGGRVLLCLIGFVAVGLWASGPAPVTAAEGRTAALVGIDGAIGPATADYVHRALAKAKESGAAFVVLRMDTPGGLETAMRDIIQDILAAPIPVVGFVSPSGGRAASAGTFILYATHVAAMAPGTNVGAATPVQIGGTPIPGEPQQPVEPEKEPGADGKSGDDAAKSEKKETPKIEPADAHERKATNDAVAFIRSLAQLRSRNAAWGEAAVREAASLPATEALERGVIDLVADDLDDLLRKIDGRTVKIGNQRVRLETKDIAVVGIDPDWRSQFLAIITDPNVAYLLMIIGIYGIIFELMNPGFVFPGVLGGISLLVALYAFQALPVDYAGVALILLGIGFLVAELFFPSFGALGIGGLAALVIGSVMLIDTDVPGYGIDWRIIAVLTGTTAAFFVFVLAMAVQARRRPVVSGRDLLIGGHGRVVDWQQGGGRVRVEGEIWQAAGPPDLPPGMRVRITSVHGLTLTVEPSGEGE
jgi:membrane-bound serine protease (ClpP class)